MANEKSKKDEDRVEIAIDDVIEALIVISIMSKSLARKLIMKNEKGGQANV